MTELTSLWLPILLSAVVVFIVSSVIHMAMPWHKNDYPKVPNEDKVMDALRPFNIPPGDYMMPRASDGKEMKSPEFAERFGFEVKKIFVLPRGKGNSSQQMGNFGRTEIRKCVYLWQKK
ncbi:MAG: hypothetical protein M1391_03865 [Bacteroidetes bacterium]|nr:hypothetical protein [Bacteroidota bacterium]